MSLPARRLLPVLLVLFLLPSSGLSGQTGDAPGRGDASPPPAARDSIAPSSVSPGGAFLRALVVPGWGHAATGSYTRAGFYFVTSGATAWMLMKTAHSLDGARDQLALQRSEIERSLADRGITDPDSLTARIERDADVQDLQQLVDARSQQMEDWTSFGFFWLLLNAADAFVSAHLADFPEPVEIDVHAAPPGARSEIRISLPVGGRPR